MQLVEDAVVLVRGRVDKREDVPKIVARELIVPDLSTGPRGPVVVNLPTARCTPPVVERFKEVLGAHPGTTEVHLQLISGGRTTVVRLDDRLRVAAGARAVRRPQGAARGRLPAGQRLMGTEPTRGGEGMPPVRLCAGTLVVEQPDQLLLDHLDSRNSWSYPAYDRLVTNGSAALVDGDLLAPNLIGAEVDRSRFLLLRELLPRISGIAQLPPVALQDAPDDVLDAVADLFGVLDEAPYAGRGVRGTILSKVLHRKRPDLVPLYDSRIFESYTAPGAIERSLHRSWRESMTLLLRQMRTDLTEERAAFDTLVAVAEAAGSPVTRLRALDILVWRTAEVWH